MSHKAKWQPGSYLGAHRPSEPLTGFIYRGLALRMAVGARKRWTAPTSDLTHLGTGHLVVRFGTPDPYPFATAVAELTDWDFDTIDGYRNRDPGMPERLQQLYRTGPIVQFRGYGGRNANHAAAQAVAYARAA
jgi:hypothetical protein